MDIPMRIDTALRILSLWHKDFEEMRANGAMSSRTALRWKAIGIVQHDRILNIESAHPIPMRTMAQVIGK